MNASTLRLNRTGLERVHYFPRQLMTADDMLAEQEYFRQKLRRHNRFLHGWGVVCGLKVAAAPTKEAPWQVSVSSGYALGPYGDEIDVPDTLCFDLAKCGPEPAANPCEPGQTRASGPHRQEALFVAIKYVERKTRPVRVHLAGCACDETACEYSRIRDDFEIGCLNELPASHRPDRSPTLCDRLSRNQFPPCPPYPEEPWLVLAAVTLPASPTTNVNDNQINNLIRRPLFSTALLQEQLIACCCQPPRDTAPGIDPGLVTQLGAHLDVQSLMQIMQGAKSDSETLRGLSATALRDVRPGSQLGKKLKTMTVSQVAEMPREAFVEMALQDMPEKQRKNARQQAETVWQHAEQINKLTSTDG